MQRKLFACRLQVDFVSFFQYMFGNNVNGATRVIMREEDWTRQMLQMVNAIPSSDRPRYSDLTVYSDIISILFFQFVIDTVQHVKTTSKR